MPQLLPPPKSFGLPPKFVEWRKGQDRVIRTLLYDRSRFQMLNLPTGSGKSASFMTLALVNADAGNRTLILTPTRALQGQLLADFQSRGLLDVRGRSNYVCLIDDSKTAADAVCTAGVYCEYAKETRGCEYPDRIRAAKDALIVVSNYAFWMYSHESESIGRFSVL